MPELNGQGNGTTLEIPPESELGVLWHLYRDHTRRNDIERAGEFLWKFYSRYLESGLGRGVVQFIEDAQEGAFSMLDPSENYPTGTKLFLVKRIDREFAEQARLDWEYLQVQPDTPIKLAPVEQPMYRGEYAMLPIQAIIGPTIGKVLEALHYAEEHGKTEHRAIARELKTRLLDKRLDDLAWWARNMGEAVPLSNRPTGVERIVKRYRESIVNAFTNAEKLTHAGQQPYTVTQLESSLLHSALGVLDDLQLDKIRRLRDDTDANSGIQLGRMKYSTLEDLAETLIGELTFEDDGILRASSDQIQISYWQWDNGNPGFGHFLEDFYRSVDSPSVGISEHEKVTRLRTYVEELDGPDGVDMPTPLDVALMRFFRNIRHRDVNITLYGRRNERGYVNKAISLEELEQRRMRYKAHARHHGQMAELALDNGIEALQACSQEEELMNVYRKVMRRERPAAETDILELGGKLRSTDPGIRQLTSLMALHYLTNRATRYSDIDFSKMQDLERQDKIRSG